MIVVFAALMVACRGGDEAGEFAPDARSAAVPCAGLGYDLTETRDFYDDGVIDSTEEWRFDASGRAIFDAEDGVDDGDGDGVWDTVCARTYAGDVLVAYECADGSGALLYRYAASVDASGRVTVEYWDGDGDGLVDSATMWEWADDGSHVERSDRDQNGVVDVESSFDAFAGRILVRYDDDGDGAFDRADAWRLAYDDDANLIYYGDDNGADGILEAQVWYTFDDGGRWLSWETDDNADGRVDVSWRWTYDPEGWSAAVIQRDSQGRSVGSDVWAFDDRGNMTRLWEEYHGHFSWVEVREYDNENRVTLRTIDREVDGKFSNVNGRGEYRIDTAYDADGLGWSVTETHPTNTNTERFEEVCLPE